MKQTNLEPQLHATAMTPLPLLHLLRELHLELPTQLKTLEGLDQAQEVQIED